MISATLFLSDRQTSKIALMAALNTRCRVDDKGSKDPYIFHLAHQNVN